MSEAGSTNALHTLPRIGSYRLIQQLGSGGMSSVFRAVHAETGHEVAVKVLPRYLAKNPTLLQRFLREAKSAEALEDPNIVAIYDRGSEGGRYYLVLEYVQGGDLHDRVRNKGPLSVDETVRILRAVVAGLRHAAGRGLIHRDIKPANLLLDVEGRVKITDLGLALQVEDEDERVTRDGTTVGTVDYMAPEQARDSRATSIRSDIYSLGCTCYYLLTGSPPFPGGDVAEKLRRHAQEPRPDVRMVRPDVPEPLARLIQKMMARRPDDRFGDHDQLLAALEALPVGRGGQEGTLDALIDDEDESGDFVLDDHPGVIGFADAGSDSGPGSTIEAPRQNGPALEDVNFSALAALDEDAAPRPRRAQQPEAPVQRLHTAPGRPPSADEIFDIDGGQAGAATATAPARRSSGDESLRSYIVRGLVFGGALVLVGVLILELVNLSGGSHAAPTAETSEEAESSASAPTPLEPGLPPPVVAKPAEKTEQDAGPGVATAKAKAKGDGATKPPAGAGWIEPAEAAKEEVAEPSYPADWESRARPAWAAEAVPERLDGPSAVVRRVTSGRDVMPDVGRALVAGKFGQGGGTVEIADDGPFYEHDLRVVGEALLVRARSGFRPMLALEPPTLEASRNQAGLIVLEGNRLILDGLDLVVKADDLPKGQTALFLLHGGELTLRDCTVTVAGSRPFTLVQVGDTVGVRPARVRLERTLVRGAALTPIRLSGAPAEVAIDRSVLLSGGGPAVAVAGKPAGPRKLYVSRSIVAAKGPALDVSATGAAAGVEVWALGSTFARLGGAGAASLIALKEEPAGGVREVVDWHGLANVVAGWDGWLSAGPSRAVKVADLPAAAAAWPGADEQAKEQATAWPDSRPIDEMGQEQLATLATERAATLTRVASPSPYLWEKTLGAFRRLSLPEPGAAAAPRPAPAPGPGLPPVAAGPGFGPPTSTAATGGAPAGEEILYDLAVPPAGFADFGQFLNAKAAHATGRLRVRVRGNGPRPITPVKTPAGLSLEIAVEPGAADGPPLWWTPAAGSSSEALFDVRGGDLTITGARMARLEPGRMAHLVRVEDGRLLLANCWLTETMGVGPEVGSLVEFQAATTRPLPGPPGSDRPACRLVDCLMMTGGTPLVAKLGRGVVALNNCAIASRSDAIVLLPQAVRRDRFEADLWLDRCTVVAERSFVRLGPWPGSGAGPDRPWLVSTSRCAWLDAFDRGSEPRRAAVVRVEEEALAGDALLWQGDGDAFDVAHFTASGDGNPPATVGGPDVRRHWVEFWGRSHIAATVTGPTIRAGSASGAPIRLAVHRIKAATAAPGDLGLDPAYPPGRKSLDVGADLARLGLAPPSRPSQPDRKRPGPSGSSSTPRKGTQQGRVSSSVD
jgi:serine/threonine-protein kinase